MLRIGSMNMILHGIENPVIEARDSLSEDIAGEKEKYSLILANPPFAGSLDYEQTARDLQQVVKTKKTELLFVALFSACCAPAVAPPSSCRTVCSSGLPRRIRNCGRNSSRSTSSTP